MSEGKNESQEQIFLKEIKIFDIASNIFKIHDFNVKESFHGLI